MLIKMVQYEDFVNYKKPSMFIGIGNCNWKCCTEANIPVTVCQNSDLANQKEIDISVEELYERYINNPITSAIVIGGLEPFTRFSDIKNLISYFRNHQCYDDFVIYTGYYENEIKSQIYILQQYSNVVIKFGRFIPDRPKHCDEILGVTLISDNQYAKRIS